VTPCNRFTKLQSHITAVLTYLCQRRGACYLKHLQELSVVLGFKHASWHTALRHESATAVTAHKPQKPALNEDFLPPFLAVKLEGVSKPRRDVALDMIRLPVEEDEDVVVFLLCQGGVWTPGKVVKRQRGRKANFSYSVQLNDGQTLQVPPAQVRRTFPAGSSVEIWRPQRGWVPAVVMEDSSELHFPRPLSKWSPAPPREESLATPRSSASESPRALGQPQSPRRRSVKDQLPKSPRALQSMWMASNDWTKALHPWIMIPVREGREKDWTKAHYALIEEVPLYLIRWPSAALALTENEKRFFPCKRRDRI